MYSISTGRGIDYYFGREMRLDTINSRSRFLLDFKYLTDSIGNEIQVKHALPKDIFFWATYVNCIGLFFKIDNAISNRFVEGDFNNLYVVKFTSFQNFCVINEELCQSGQYYTNSQYLIPIKDGWYIFESNVAYSPEGYLYCKENLIEDSACSGFVNPNGDAQDLKSW